MRAPVLPPMLPPVLPPSLPKDRASARVLVVGVGGIGCPAALGLVDGGVRRLTLVDDDAVAASNLHRQILYRDADAGQPKAPAAGAALARRCEGVVVSAMATRLDARGALALVAEHDLVVDGTDSPVTKFLLNDACVRLGVALVHAGAVRWGGQVLAIPTGGPCLRCVFERPPPGRELACALEGVVGPAVGVVGALASARGLALIDGRAVGGELIVYDALHSPPGARDGAGLRRVRFRRDPACPACAAAGRSDAPWPPPDLDGVADACGDLVPADLASSEPAPEIVGAGHSAPRS